MNQEQALVKSTPLEETRLKIQNMIMENKQSDEAMHVQDKIEKSALRAATYMITYIKMAYGLSYSQVINLSKEDLDRMPEIIFSRMDKRVLLVGWIPIFGWYFIGEYLRFKSRIKFLRSLNVDICQRATIINVIRDIYGLDSRDYATGSRDGW